MVATGADRIVIKGSDTLGAKLVPQLAETFRSAEGEVVFEIAAEGSSTGIAALIDGTADLAMSSRRVQASESSLARGRGVNMKPFVVSYDAMAVVVHESNPFPVLSTREVEQIFTGDVTDWSAIGGPAGTISVYTRNTASGTYRDWQTLAMSRRDYAPSAQKMAGNEQIAAEVAANPMGIGYVGLAYTTRPGLRVVAIRTGTGAEPVLPSVEAVNARLYPYARPNFLYTNGEPTGALARFIAFALGTEGQRIVAETGFVPVKGATGS